MLPGLGYPTGSDIQPWYLRTWCASYGTSSAARVDTAAPSASRFHFILAPHPALAEPKRALTRLAVDSHPRRGAKQKSGLAPAGGQAPKSCNAPISLWAKEKRAKPCVHALHSLLLLRGSRVARCSRRPGSKAPAANCMGQRRADSVCDIQTRLRQPPHVLRPLKLLQTAARFPHPRAYTQNLSYMAYNVQTRQQSARAWPRRLASGRRRRRRRSLGLRLSRRFLLRSC